MTTKAPRIGFSIHDGAHDGRAFEIEPQNAKALVFGQNATVRVSAQGVLGKHFVVLPHEGVLLAASSSGQAPAFVGETPIGTS